MRARTHMFGAQSALRSDRIGWLPLCLSLKTHGNPRRRDWGRRVDGCSFCVRSGKNCRCCPFAATAESPPSMGRPWRGQKVLSRVRGSPRLRYLQPVPGLHDCWGWRREECRVVSRTPEHSFSEYQELPPPPSQDTQSWATLRWAGVPHGEKAGENIWFRLKQSYPYFPGWYELKSLLIFNNFFYGHLGALCLPRVLLISRQKRLDGLNLWPRTAAT